MLARLTTVLSFLTLCLAPLLEARQTQDPTLEQRLEVLAERMEAERLSNHIPGFALAVVKGDEVVFARGFGVADVEAGRAVEADTIFAIGSTTKAFTSASIGMLQDDGVLDFDDPVTSYLPEFELQVNVTEVGGDSTVTLRDLLAHRTGFTRMSLLWVGGDATREAILRTAVNAKPWAEFRDKFLYNNVMYLAAGMASAEAAETTWEELVDARILTPLGMDSTTFTASEAQQDSRLALGYEWNADSESFDKKHMLNLRTIGPAGCINSNVLDMAQWVRMLLANGEYEGERLISEAALGETWTSNMSMGGDADYGMGWMLHEHNGRRVVEHGGSISGFGAQVSLMPGEGLGYVLLTNVTATPLQQSSIGVVFDTLLEELGADAAAASDFDDYVGNYRANFASFDDVDFEVLVQNDHLAVDVPGQMIYELRAPDEEGKWYFRLTNTVAISFYRDTQDELLGMQMHQAGMTFELPREGVEVAAEIPLTELERFVGTYDPVGQSGIVEVLIQNQRLAVDIPGEMTFELHAPNDDGLRYFRVTDKVRVRFNEDDSGAVVSMTIFENDDEEYEVLRMEGPVEAAASLLPTVEELLELHQPEGYARLLAEHGTLRVRGTVVFEQSGIEGTFESLLRLDPLESRINLEFGEFGGMERGTTGDKSWLYTPSQGYVEESGGVLRQSLRAHPALVHGDWGTSYDSLRVKGQAELDGVPVLVAKASWGDVAPWTLYINRETGALLRMEHLHDAGLAKFPLQHDFADFRNVAGVPLAHTMIEENDWSGRTVSTVLELEVGVDLAPDFHVYSGTRD